ncbi:hypothetical protein LMH87_007328 [Akanthomyces muscarius]|uniref:Uncharacterized protein n=1 Tax=Akanthomyces muscarius TaxID=2231603 RepID=A0A9W8QSW5_AKAMU|nr:hypothetical protein LMH87_007328 [Akanthomyces muscarius]KAJ4165707.1 hypothetical protein LMH87_007328 [Akanthomyces muscarius]
MSTSGVQRQHQRDEEEQPTQKYEDHDTPHDSDDELMVYETPRDYGSWARQERDRRLASGTDPDMVILQSEVRDHVPRQGGESGAEYAKRYCNTMNSMIGRGVVILNDQCTADVVASSFRTGDGRRFDLGPGSGATKGEFRKFGRWFSKSTKAGTIREVPEQWKKFEKQEPSPDTHGN